MYKCMQLVKTWVIIYTDSILVLVVLYCRGEGSCVSIIIDFLSFGMKTPGECERFFTCCHKLIISYLDFFNLAYTYCLKELSLAHLILKMTKFLIGCDNTLSVFEEHENSWTFYQRISHLLKTGSTCHRQNQHLEVHHDLMRLPKCNPKKYIL